MVSDIVPSMYNYVQVSFNNARKHKHKYIPGGLVTTVAVYVSGQSKKLLFLQMESIFVFHLCLQVTVFNVDATRPDIYRQSPIFLLLTKDNINRSQRNKMMRLERKYIMFSHFDISSNLLYTELNIPIFKKQPLYLFHHDSSFESS